MKVSRIVWKSGINSAANPAVSARITNWFNIFLASLLESKIFGDASKDVAANSVKSNVCWFSVTLP